MKTNKELADEIRNKTIGKVILNMKEFEDDLMVKQFNSETITLAGLVEQITDEDPYAMMYVQDNIYRLQNKDIYIPIESHVNPEQLQKLPMFYPAITKIYPELKEYLSIKPCTSCSVTAHSILALNCIVRIGGIGRDLTHLISAVGEVFVEKMKIREKDTELDYKELLEIRRKGNEKAKKSSSENHIVHQCLDCTKEHVAKAIGLLLEYYKDKTLYYSHFWRAIGQLGLAEVECIHINNKMSEGIRKEKTKLLQNNSYIPNLEQFFDYK